VSTPLRRHRTRFGGLVKLRDRSLRSPNFVAPQAAHTGRLFFPRRVLAPCPNARGSSPEPLRHSPKLPLPRPGTSCKGVGGGHLISVKVAGRDSAASTTRPTMASPLLLVQTHLFLENLPLELGALTSAQAKFVRAAGPAVRAYLATLGFGVGACWRRWCTAWRCPRRTPVPVPLCLEFLH
jgi:hypothetical protein